MPVTLESIATIRSCYTQRFGIPRQAGLVPSAHAVIAFEANEHNLLSLRGLEEFSHIWVIFLFHSQHYEKAKPLVQPPRLGGKKSIGVYATRSPNRPNPVGLSCVALEKIEPSETEILLHIRGGDFLDQTPVLDIKPYVAFADAVDNSTCAWAAPITQHQPVVWEHGTLQSLSQLCTEDGNPADSIQCIIEETISLDPRPAYERNKDGKTGQQWHMRLYDYDISFGVNNGIAAIQKVQRYLPPHQQ